MPVTALAFSADGGMLASSSWDSSIRLWRVTAAGEPLGPFDRQLGRPRIQTLALSADGRLMATAANEEVVSVWDLGAGTFAHRMTGHSNWVHSVAFSADGTRLATGSADDSLRLWNVDNGDNVSVLPGHVDDGSASEAVQVASSRLENVLAYTALDDGVRIWRVEAGEVVAARYGLGLGPALALSPVAPVAAFGTLVSLKVWFWKADELHSLADIDGVTRLAFAPDGSVPAVAQTVWSSPSGDWLPEAEWRHAVHLFAAFDWSPLHRLDVPGQTTALAFAADQKRLFVGLENGRLGVWDVEGGELLYDWASHTGAATGLAVLPGGRVLVSAGEDGAVKLWALGEQRLLATAQAFSSGDWLAFTPEGFFDGTRRAWKLAPFCFSSEPGRLYEPEQFFLQFFQPGLLANLASSRRRLSRRSLSALPRHRCRPHRRGDRLVPVGAGAGGRGPASRADELAGVRTAHVEKGMHVLAAAQGYRAALEASVLQHGLLTYALVQEGLTEERAYRAGVVGSSPPVTGLITL